MHIAGGIIGMLEVELTSAEMEAALDAVNNSGIELARLKRISELTCIFCIRRSDYAQLAKLCRKRGETLRIRRKTGIYWTAAGLLKRPVLMAGCCVLLMLMFYLPTRVLFVRVEGNVTVPEKQILAAAENCGIRFGASRRKVRSEQTKNALLSEIEELQWAGVNTSGCVAVISVRERSLEEQAEQEASVASIVASRDGYVLSCTSTKGRAVVQPGQAVKEGQVLISGYTDCGLCIQATKAEGEVFALTNRQFAAVCPSQYTGHGQIRSVKRKYSILLRKKRINLWKDSGIWDGSCGRIYKEYYITLPGGFRLPFALCVEEYVGYETMLSEVPQADAEASLREFAECYLSRQMTAGKILNAVQPVSYADGICWLQGQYSCMEMIGKLRQEEIGDTNGKIS